MNLKLHKPLCIFDLETTGTNIGKDRIVEICILKVNPDASRESKTWRVNPEMPIPKECSEIHGIYGEDVKDAPTFRDIAAKIMEMISGSDLGGFNSNRFDVPLLAEELLRVGMDFDLSKFRLVDAQTIFHKKEPRNLGAAYQFYCGKTLENAHSAEADVMATFEVLDAQVGKYDDIPNEIAPLSEFTFHNKNADLAGFIGYNEKMEEIFNFGKYKGQGVKAVFQKDLGYFGWLQNADFPLYTKKIFTKNTTVKQVLKMSDLVRFKFYETALEANRDKQILAENGVNSFIANEQLIQSDWLLSQAVGGIQLQVFEEDVEKARQILQDYKDNEQYSLEVEHTIEDPEFDFVCPKCGSNHIYRDDSATSFFGISFLTSHKFKCYYCGNEFTH